MVTHKSIRESEKFPKKNFRFELSVRNLMICDSNIWSGLNIFHCCCFWNVIHQKREKDKLMENIVFFFCREFTKSISVFLFVVNIRFLWWIFSPKKCKREKTKQQQKLKWLISFFVVAISNWLQKKITSCCLESLLVICCWLFCCYSLLLMLRMFSTQNRKKRSIHLRYFCFQ